MPQFTISDRHSHDRFLSPRKSLIVTAFVCALSAIALFAGPAPSAVNAVDTDAAHQSANSATDSHVP